MWLLSPIPLYSNQPFNRRNGHCAPLSWFIIVVSTAISFRPATAYLSTDRNTLTATTTRSTRSQHMITFPNVPVPTHVNILNRGVRFLSALN